MSITLETPTLVQVNGTTIENDTDGAVTMMTVDYLANTAVFTIRTGTIQGGNLNAGNYGPSITLTIDLSTGNWWSEDSASGATLNGTMAAPDLANLVATITQDRNMIETFVCGDGGILPGAQVPW